MKLGKLIDIFMGKNSQKCFAQFRELIPKSKNFSIDQPTIIRQKSIMMTLQILILLNICAKTSKH